MASNTPTALVTGGSRGIGLGIARCLARAGFDLAINGRRPEADVADVLADLRTTGCDVLYCPADIASTADRTALLDAVEGRFGRLDVLVNNAGIAPARRDDLLEATEESFDRLLAVNLKGPYFLTQDAANRMIRRKQADESFRGCIVNVSSVSAVVASPNRGEYCLTKAALAMATQLFAVRLAEFGIDVYEVRPGIIATDMTAGVKDKYDRLIADGLTLTPRWGTPEDVGRAVAMLARGELTYATGQVLTIDGGLTARRL